MKHRRILFGLLLLAGVIATLRSNAQMIYDTLLLGELEILANKADYTSTTKHQSIDSLFLQNLNSEDIGEVLSKYTPVYIRSYGKGSLSTASFRGTGASHTQVIWNDFRINSPMLGQSDFSLMPTSFFDKVELYYGGASLVKSEGGLGGNISLYSDPFNGKKPLLYFTQTAGSFKSFTTSAGLNLGSNKFNSDSRFIFQTSANDFTYYNDAIAPPQDMQQHNAAYQNGGFSQQFTYKPGINHAISLASWTQWNHRDIPPVMSKAEASKNLTEYEDDFFSRNTISWLFHKNKSKLEVKAAWFYEDYQYHQDLLNENSGTKDTLINSQNKTNGIFARANYSTSFTKGFSLSTGLNYDYDNVNSNNYSSIKYRNSIGAFAKLDKRFLQRITLSLMLRAQMTDNEFLPLMPLFGLNLKILNNHDFYFRSSISRNYHLPSLNDMYWNPGGNENLNPEDGYELEAGLNYIFTKQTKFLIKTDLTAYTTKVDNWIQWVDNGSTYWTPLNISKVYSRGFEFSAQLQGFIKKVSYQVYGQYAFTRTTNQSQQAIDDGKDQQQLIYIPKHTLNAYLNLSIRGYYFDWQLHYIGEQNTVGDQLPSYLLNDLALGKSWMFGKSAMNLRFRMNNIFDVQYQSVASRAMPGRNYEIIIKYILNK